MATNSQLSTPELKKKKTKTKQTTRTGTKSQKWLIMAAKWKKKWRLSKVK